MAFGNPQDLVFTLFGDFLLHRSEPVSVGGLIRLLEPLRMSATNVRTVLSRMTAKGWLEAAPELGRGNYQLSPRGRRLLEAGETRIHQPPIHEAWDGVWTLLAYSIPEDRRSHRDRLRARLAWLGFGSLGNGLWVSPHDLRRDVDDLVAELEVGEHLELFRATHIGFSTAADLVARCWDLEALNRRYDRFVDRHLERCVRLRDEGPGSIVPRRAFVRRFRLVHEYREFPSLDPFLPRPLQPDGWAGECALALFQFYHDLLREPAERFVSGVLDPVPRPAPGPASAT